MVAPRPRCWHYDEDGNALRGGCHRQGAGCFFLHPSDPGWVQARTAFAPGGKPAPETDSGPAQSFRGGGHGRGRGGAPPRGPSFLTGSNSSASAGTGWPSKSASVSSTWDTSAWGPTDGKGMQQQQSSSSSGGGWGNGGDDVVVANWATESSEKLDDVGWGANSGGGDAESGWGQPKEETKATSNAWGGATPSAGKKSDVGAGGWGNGVASGSSERVQQPASGKGWGRRKDSGDWDASEKREIVVKDKSPVKERGRRDGRSTQTEPTWSVQSSRDNQVKTDTSATQENVRMGDWTDVPRASSPGSRAPSPAGTEQTASTSRPVTGLNLPASVIEKKSKWSIMIGLVANAVRLDSELKEAEQKRIQFKRAQNSASYSRVGLAARATLDKKRLEVEETVLDVRKRISVVMKALFQLTEIPRSHVSDFDPQEHEAEVKRYTAEVKEWIEDLRKTLLLTTTNLPRQPPPSPKHPPRLPEPRDAPPPAKRPRLSTPNIEARDGPRSALATRLLEFEGRMEKLQGDILLSNYTTIRDSVDEKIEQRFVALTSEMKPPRARTAEDGECTPDPPPARASTSQVLECSQKLTSLGDDVRELKQNLAEMQNNQHSRDEEAKQVRAKTQLLLQNHSSLRDQLTQCEKICFEQSQQDQLKIQQVSALLQNPPAQSLPEPPPQIPRDELMRDIETFVTGIFHREVFPILSDIPIGCANEIMRHKEAVYQEFWTILQKPLKMAEAISLILDAKNPH